MRIVFSGDITQKGYEKKKARILARMQQGLNVLCTNQKTRGGFRGSQIIIFMQCLTNWALSIRGIKAGIFLNFALCAEDSSYLIGRNGILPYLFGVCRINSSKKYSEWVVKNLYSYCFDCLPYGLLSAILLVYSLVHYAWMSFALCTMRI